MRARQPEGSVRVILSSIQRKTKIRQEVKGSLHLACKPIEHSNQSWSKDLHLLPSDYETAAHLYVLDHEKA